MTDIHCPVCGAKYYKWDNNWVKYRGEQPRHFPCDRIRWIMKKEEWIEMDKENVRLGLSPSSGTIPND